MLYQVCYTSSTSGRINPLLLLVLSFDLLSVKNVTYPLKLLFDNVFWDMFQGLKNQVKVKLSIVSCPPVTTVLIKRPDLKFQLGFSVQNGIVSKPLLVSSVTPNFRLMFEMNGWQLLKSTAVFKERWLCYTRCAVTHKVSFSRPQICSLMRGGIAERGGVRVGHRIIEINGQSVVAMAHEKIVQTLSVSVGEVRTLGHKMAIFSDYCNTQITEPYRPFKDIHTN